MITSLTKKFVRKLIAKSDEEAKHQQKNVSELNIKLQDTISLGQNQGRSTKGGSFMPEPELPSWSADFVTSKGEGLIFLLHGKPGVRKTYTAGQFTSLRLHTFYIPIRSRSRLRAQKKASQSLTFFPAQSASRHTQSDRCFP